MSKLDKAIPYTCYGKGDLTGIQINGNDQPNLIDVSRTEDGTEVHVQHFEDGSTRPKFCDHLKENGTCSKLQDITHAEIFALSKHAPGSLMPVPFTVTNKPCKVITE